MSRKKYVVIIKVDTTKFVKYRVWDLLKLVDFLNTQWPEWRWFNVYDKDTGEQLDNFTKNSLPEGRRLDY